ncbi:MAG: family 20 glycosylhydrolase, partial [Lentisphaeria bacterium]
MLKRSFMCFLFLSLCLHAIDIAKPGLIPKPQEITWAKKTSRIQTISLNVKSKKVEAFTLKTLQSIFSENEISRGNGYTIILEEAKMDVPRYADEAYTLEVGARSAILRAQTNRGFFYGVQTIRQLIVNIDGRCSIAHCKIVDYPAFQIRGFMHDVGRNFISLDLLKKQIELMSKYKYNVFQWHLSDHHGWRLESKVVPELQGEKAFLRFHGKYYTQKEFVDFVKFCAERQILVIPELDSPGHTDAFRQALGLKTMNDQRANDAIVKLMDELCSLVPKEQMPYIHIGTDEVKSHERPNGTYIKDIYDVLKKNNRQAIGWWKGISAPNGYSQIQ